MKTTSQQPQIFAQLWELETFESDLECLVIDGVVLLVVIIAVIRVITNVIAIIVNIT